MKSNLPNQDVSSSVFNEDVSFYSIIKGSVGSGGSGGADAWVLTQEQHDSVVRERALAPSTGGTVLVTVNFPKFPDTISYPFSDLHFSCYTSAVKHFYFGRQKSNKTAHLALSFSSRQNTRLSCACLVCKQSKFINRAMRSLTQFIKQ